MDSAAVFLSPWVNFYVILGSAGGALTGLTFIVITIVQQTGRARSAEGISVFTTPTVVHFSATLVVAAVMTAPWKIVICPAITLGILGLAGVAYVIRNFLIARNFHDYVPDTEDLLAYFILPFVAYALIAAGSLLLLDRVGSGLFVVGGGTLLLILMGIKNAWDVVTYLTLRADDA